MNPSTALARVLVDELVRCGLTDVVLAPGSRSAPLAMAAHHHAHEAAGRHDAQTRLRLHVRIDERSAGFLALGLAKTSGRPAAVVCTSGTAAANLHPAVIEASQAGVPLLALTADRPPELRDTGANQTIDQVKLYGGAVRWFTEVGVPEARAGAVAYWRSLACRAWAHAAGAEPGPAHLNLTFREPLVPDGAQDWPEPLHGRPHGAPWTVPAHASGPAGEADLPRAERGLLVAGDANVDPAPYVALAERRGWPVLAEPTSGARYGPNALSNYHHLLANPGFAKQHRPDVVVTLGKPGLSRAVLGMLESAGKHVVVGPEPGWPDPTRSATEIVPGTAFTGPRAEMRATASSGAHAPPPTTWLQAWREADEAARAVADDILDSQTVPTQPGLARDLAAALPDSAVLFAGSSMPIRDLDRTMRPRSGIRVLGNRGASGIDGSVSTAIGAALAHSGRTYALLGDLTLLHDQNGLLLGPEEPRPDLTIVVVNNDGGGIFSLLPQGAHPEPFERVFGTPHGARLDHVAATVGIQYRRIHNLGELPDALVAGGLRLVEVRTSRQAESELHTQIQNAVDAALDSHRP